MQGVCMVNAVFVIDMAIEKSDWQQYKCNMNCYTHCDMQEGPYNNPLYVFSKVEFLKIIDMD
jgi:hypothetical protein